MGNGSTMEKQVSFEAQQLEQELIDVQDSDEDTEDEDGISMTL